MVMELCCFLFGAEFVQFGDCRPKVVWISWRTSYLEAGNFVKGKWKLCSSSYVPLSYICVVANFCNSIDVLYGTMKVVSKLLNVGFSTVNSVVILSPMCKVCFFRSFNIGFNFLMVTGSWGRWCLLQGPNLSYHCLRAKWANHSISWMSTLFDCSLIYQNFQLLITCFLIVGFKGGFWKSVTSESWYSGWSWWSDATKLSKWTFSFIQSSVSIQSRCYLCKCLILWFLFRICSSIL